jgi:hypothetical protein
MDKGAKEPPATCPLPLYLLDLAASLLEAAASEIYYLAGVYGPQCYMQARSKRGKRVPLANVESTEVLDRGGVAY